ncbi:MAG: hypothetical protein AMXMBFR23_21420 [Chloroflexota bacterium]
MRASDPLAEARYGSTLNSVSAEPGETLAILRRNARFALQEIEDGRGRELPVVLWEMLEIEFRIHDAELKKHQNRGLFSILGGYNIFEARKYRNRLLNALAQPGH